MQDQDHQKKNKKDLIKEEIKEQDTVERFCSFQQYASNQSADFQSNIQEQISESSQAPRVQQRQAVQPPVAAPQQQEGQNGNFQQNPPEPRGASSHSYRPLLAIFLIYVLYLLITDNNPQSLVKAKIIGELLSLDDNNVPFGLHSLLLRYYEQKATFVGRWESISRKQTLSQAYGLSSTGNGKALLNNIHANSQAGVSSYAFQMDFYNGNYIDSGVFTKLFYFNSSWIKTTKNKQELIVEIKKTQPLTELPFQPSNEKQSDINSTIQDENPVKKNKNEAGQNENTIQQSSKKENGPNDGKNLKQETADQKQQQNKDSKQKNGGQAQKGNSSQMLGAQCLNSFNRYFRFQNIPLRSNMTLLKFRYRLSKISDGAYTLSTFVQLQDEYGFLSVELQGKENRLAKIGLFALVLILIALSESKASTQIVTELLEGAQSPLEYSLLTVLFCYMEDVALAFLSFSQSMSYPENILLFIVPAFILCMVFSSKEAHMIMLIFQAQSGYLPIQQLMCKFNLITYGCILIIFPILYLTNCNWLLYLFLSSFMFPQIYCNAINSRRPDITKPYYSRFLLMRFIIIAYFKAFPYNIYDIEPDYILCALCLGLLMLQIFLLNSQFKYGPKSVLPKFLLPPVYNYQFEAGAHNLEQNEIQQCSICLNTIYQEPAENNDQQQPKYRLMQTPCGHIYHGLCLMQWMKVKMQCPQCRNNLPNYQ